MPALARICVGVRVCDVARIIENLLHLHSICPALRHRDSERAHLIVHHRAVVRQHRIAAAAAFNQGLLHSKVVLRRCIEQKGALSPSVRESTAQRAFCCACTFDSKYSVRKTSNAKNNNIELSIRAHISRAKVDVRNIPLLLFFLVTNTITEFAALWTAYFRGNERSEMYVYYQSNPKNVQHLPNT